MKCTVLLVFSCVFTVFSLRKHLLLVHFICLQKYTCTIYFTWNAKFSSVFIYFHCVFTAETCTFVTFHMYTKIHMYYILFMKSTVLLVLSCVFTAETCTFGTFHMYTKIHMDHILYMKFTVCFKHASVFMCFHCRNM
jgi:hypothetical protein